MNEDTCDLCEIPVAWVRRTQFAGDHFFCDHHATKEEDFLDKDTFWDTYEQYKESKKDRKLQVYAAYSKT